MLHFEHSENISPEIENGNPPKSPSLLSLNTRRASGGFQVSVSFGQRMGIGWPTGTVVGHPRGTQSTNQSTSSRPNIFFVGVLSRGRRSAQNALSLLAREGQCSHGTDARRQMLRKYIRRHSLFSIRNWAVQSRAYAKTASFLSPSSELGYKRKIQAPALESAIDKSAPVATPGGDPGILVPDKVRYRHEGSKIRKAHVLYR